MSQGKKLYFISDLHIGGEGILNRFTARKKFIALLDKLKKESKKYDLTLYILGDFLNLWEIQSHKELDKFNHIVQSHPKIFQKIKQVGRLITINVIPGNHDHELACFKEYPRLFKKWNLNLLQQENLSISINNKKIWVEHGNRFDSANKIERFGDINDTPYGYHVQKNIILKIINYAQKHPCKNPWLADLPFFNYPYKIGPGWFISNYFYKELAPFLRYLLTPFFILFIFNLVILIFSILTYTDLIKTPDIFYITNYLGPVKYLTNFVIGYNLILLIVYLSFYLAYRVIKKDLKNSLKDYGINLKSKNYDINRHRWHETAKNFLAQNKEHEILIFGHSHTDFMEKHKNKIIVNTGSWTKTFKPIKTWSNLPNVYIPYFKLSYLIITPVDQNKLKLELKYWPKKAKVNLTKTQKISTLFKKVDTPSLKDKTLII
ncbi:MAG: hypothetical protein GF347_04680 [Candidatus Moranbacteria bacterium]|nr:hypothetical protein [Candidatus Moranbacteria bacterium]